MFHRLTALIGILSLLCAFGLGAGIATGAAAAKKRVVFLLDSTSDMAAVFDDASKLAAVKKALLSALPVHASDFDIGFLLYGHKLGGAASCSQIDPLGPIGPFVADDVNAELSGLKTKGDAPVAAALKMAFASKQLTEGNTSVILVAGGPDACHADPCEAAGKIAAEHSVPVNVIAIDAGGEADALQSLKCVADNTKGEFWRVGSTMELAAALDDALTAINKQTNQTAAAAATSASPFTNPASAQEVAAAQPAAGSDKPADAEISFSALLTDAGPQLTSGLTWNVFASPGGNKGPVKLVSSSREGAPSFKLASGDYLVNVTYGRAYVTKSVKVAPGPQNAQLIVNAGGLNIAAKLADGSAIPGTLVLCDVFSDQRDQSGSRIKVLSGIRPGTTVRLNAGLYHLAATYGDANATVGADIGVEAGKITEAEFTMTGAKITFKLVQRAGGEALTGTAWTITAAGGEAIKQSIAALPTHILAAGSYTVTAERAGKKYTQDFTVAPSQSGLIEVLAATEP